MIGYNEIAQVSRYLDAESEEGRDFEDMLRERGIEPEGFVKAAQQRALRVGMIISGQDPRKLSRTEMTPVDLPEESRELLVPLQMAYMDGFIAGRVCCDPNDRIQRFPQRED